MNDIDVDEKKSARTYNNYLKFLQTMFNWMKEKGYVPENPFEGIKRKPKRLTAKTRRTISNEELSRLCTFLSENNPHYLLAVLLCYGCFIRPKELSMLKCSDIDLDKQHVHIRPEIAKNDNDSYRTIPDALVPFMRTADLSHPEWRSSSLIFAMTLTGYDTKIAASERLIKDKDKCVDNSNSQTYNYRFLQT